MHILPFRTYYQIKTRSEITYPSDKKYIFFMRKYILLCIYSNNKIKYFSTTFFMHAPSGGRPQPSTLPDLEI